MPDIRFDFISDTEGAVKGTVVDSIAAENGQCVLAVNTTRDLQSKQMRIDLPLVDSGTGGYYMYVKSKYELSSGVACGCTFVGACDAQTASYPSFQSAIPSCSYGIN